MKYVHPDIVVGEPVPEVEPRVNEVVLAHRLVWIRVLRWVVALLLALVIAFAIFRVSMMVRYVAAGVFYVGFLTWAFHPSVQKNRKKHAADRWSIPLRVEIRFQILLGLVISLLLILLMTGDGISEVGPYLGMMALFGGGALICMSFVAREPGQICCVDCEYPLVGLTIPCACPECGRMIYDASWTTDRARVRSGWFVPVGVLAAAFGGLMVYSSFANPGLMYGPMPRGVLMQLAPTDRDAFDELVARPMDSMQTDELIERLIAGNEGEDGWGYSTTNQQRWLAQFAGTGKISWDQYERMYGRVADWVRIELIDSGRGGGVRVGEEAAVRLISPRYIRLADAGVVVRYFFRGFEIGDDPDLKSGSTSEHYLSFLDGELGDSAYQYVQRASFVPDEPGELMIRGRVVVAMLPVQWKTQIRWDDPDGLFEVEPAWWKVIDLEHEIEVLP